MMDKARIEEICRERLGRWTQHLVGEHATPVVLVGIGHDYNSGKIVICTTEEMSNEEMSNEDISLFLVGAIKELVREDKNEPH